jgi:spore coat polysaccharide biosynthesis protein SpsF
MQALGIVQARMGSSRFPGKMLIDLGGHTVLGYLCEELQRSRLGGDFVIATTVGRSDDPIAQFCQRAGFDCFRGDVEDVLGRFAALVRSRSPEHVVRLTGDNPLLPAAIIDLALEEHLRADADYTFTGAYYSEQAPSFPDGWEVEVLRSQTLLEIDARARDSEDREHVTRLALRGEVNLVKQALQASVAHAYPQIKLTLDDRSDLERLRRYYRLIEREGVDRLELPRHIAAESLEPIK